MACVDCLLCQLMYSIVILPCVFVILHQRKGVYSDENYVSGSARISAVAGIVAGLRSISCPTLPPSSLTGKFEFENYIANLCHQKL